MEFLSTNLFVGKVDWSARGNSQLVFHAVFLSKIELHRGMGYDLTRDSTKWLG
jgi:hypothetical protein